MANNSNQRKGRRKLFDAVLRARYHSPSSEVSGRVGTDTAAANECAMRETDQSFVPGSILGPVGQAVQTFVTRHLTWIAIAVAVVGGLLVVLGPVRALIAARVSEPGDLVMNPGGTGGGLGLLNIKTTRRNGRAVAVREVREEDEEGSRAPRRRAASSGCKEHSSERL